MMKKVLITSVIGIMMLNNHYASSENILTEQQLNAIKEVRNIIDNKYIDSNLFDKQKMTNGLLNGIIQSIDDPYSTYLNPEELIEFENNTNGHFGGIGIEMSRDKKLDQYISVVNVFPNTPSAKAGIEAGDIIIAINDHDVSNLTLFQVSKHVRGQVGTFVKIKLIRKSDGKEYTLSLKREDIKLDSISLKYYKQIPVIEIRMFNQSTYTDFVATLNKINPHHIKGVILDLRNNPGGLLEPAVHICDLFLPSKAIITTVIGKNNTIIQEYKSSNKNRVMLHQFPIHVLTNKGSASAAEVLAGCIKDNKIGLLVGEKTFGKASVQEVINLDSIDGAAVKLTIAKYLTPNGDMIHGVGIEPDIEVADNRANNKDTILSAAIEEILSNR